MNIIEAEGQGCEDSLRGGLGYSMKSNLGGESCEDKVVMISKEKNGSVNGQDIPVGWENHSCGGFTSELRDGNHLSLIFMLKGISSTF